MYANLTQPTAIRPLPSRPSRYTVRPMRSNDFTVLKGLEEEIWGSQGEPTLCAMYMRLCVEQFADVCFVALDGDRPVGYVLNILRDGSAYCATLAVHPEYRRSRVTFLLVSAMIRRLREVGVHECWFTVSPENTAAREVHQTLGACVVETREDYYGPGDTRLVSRIDFDQIDRLYRRFVRAA